MRLLTLLCLAPLSAFAQATGDDWNSFPPAGPNQPPPKSTPPEDTTPPITPTPPPPRKTPPAPAPADTTPAVAPTTTTPPAPAPTTAPAETTPAIRPPPPPRKTGPLATPPADAAKDSSKDDDQATVISTKERYAPGSEPHSPSTWDAAKDFSNHYADKKNHRYTASVLGGIGLLHVQSADPGMQGLFRVSAVGEYFQNGNFPVLSAQDTRTAGTFAVSYVPLDWLETYLAYAASANTNSLSSPPLIQTLGDITLGAKGAYRISPGFFAAIDLRLLSFSGVGNQSASRYAWGFSPRALVSYDFREPWPKVPLIGHANLGFIFDNTHSLTQSAAAEHPLDAAEQFALGVQQYNRFLLGFGLEAPIPVATPFIEYNLGVPLGAHGLVGPDNAPVSVAATMPQTFTFGFKVTAIKDLTLMLAFDAGLAQSVAVGIPATMPFDFFFAASFNVDPFVRGEARIIETVRERKVKEEVKVAKTGKVTGVIVDSATHKPIPGVIVAMVGAGLPPVATDAQDGRFLTHELPQGPMKLQIQKDGYKDVLQDLVVEAGKTEQLEVALDPLAKNAHFLVTVVSKKKPIAASVILKGAIDQTVSTAEGVKEPSKLDAPAGKYVVNVTATGYLAKTREVQVSENAEMQLAFELDPEPKKRLVVVKENKIEILQQVHFATGKATILQDSNSLLNQVLDAIVVNGIKRVRVEGHTDNRGGKDTNQKLSADRAKAVADFLIKAGIDASRIEAVGYGDTRPVAPNLTARGRELNRRSEFVILER